MVEWKLIRVDFLPSKRLLVSKSASRFGNDSHFDSKLISGDASHESQRESHIACTGYQGQQLPPRRQTNENPAIVNLRSGRIRERSFTNVTLDSIVRYTWIETKLQLRDLVTSGLVSIKANCPRRKSQRFLRSISLSSTGVALERSRLGLILAVGQGVGPQ